MTIKYERTSGTTANKIMARNKDKRNKAEQRITQQRRRTAESQRRQPQRRTTPNNVNARTGTPRRSGDAQRVAERKRQLQERKRRQEREQRILYNDGYAGFEKEFEPVQENRKPVSPTRRRFARFVTVFLLIMCFVIAGVVLSCTVFFMTENITVTFPKDFKNYTSHQIIEASGLKIGENLFLSDKKGAEKKIIENYAYVKDASVEISLPDTLEIIITKAVPKCYFQSPSGYMVLGDNNRILEITKKTDKFKLPLIKGVDIENGEIGSTAVFKNANVQKVLYSIIEASEKCELKSMTEIDMSLMSNIVLGYEDRIKIVLGTHEDIDYKLKTASTIISEKLTQSDAGTLDVSLCNSGKKQSSFLPVEVESSMSALPQIPAEDSDSETDTESLSTESTNEDDGAIYEPEYDEGEE